MRAVRRAATGERSGGLAGFRARSEQSAANKQDALIRLGGERGAAVQPMWQGNHNYAVGSVFPERCKEKS